MVRIAKMTAALALVLAASTAPAAAQVYGADMMLSIDGRRGEAPRLHMQGYVTGIIRGVRLVEGFRTDKGICIPEQMTDGTVFSAVRDEVRSITDWRSSEAGLLVVMALLRTFGCRDGRLR